MWVCPQALYSQIGGVWVDVAILDSTSGHYLLILLRTVGAMSVGYVNADSLFGQTYTVKKIFWDGLGWCGYDSI